MARSIETDVRSMIASKQAQIKIVDGREPSLKELSEDKPVMRMVPGKGLMMYVRHGNQRYHVKFSADPKQLGRVRVDDIEPDPAIGTAFIDEDVLPVVPSAKGGTGQDLSGSTGLVKVASGVGSAATLVNADVSGSAAIATSKITGAATSIVSHGLATSATTDTTSASNITSGILPTAQHSAHVTNNLDANGLKVSRNIGDAIKRVTIFNGSNRTTVAATSDGDTPTTDVEWVQTGTTYVKKVEFNYVHDPDILSLVLFCNLRTTALYTAYARLAVYEIVAGGTNPITASATIINDTGAVAETSTTSATYVPLETGKVNVSGLDPSSGDILYRAAIEIKTNHATAATAYMTGVAVVAWGQ